MCENVFIDILSDSAVSLKALLAYIMLAFLSYFLFTIQAGSFGISLLTVTKPYV